MTQKQNKIRIFTSFDIVDLKQIKKCSTLPKVNSAHQLTKYREKLSRVPEESVTNTIFIAEGANSLECNRIVYTCIIKYIPNAFEKKKLLLNLYYDGKIEFFNYNNSKPENGLYLTKDSRIKVNETPLLYHELYRHHKFQKTYKSKKKYCFNFILESTMFQRDPIEFSLCDYDEYLDLMQSINKIVSYCIQTDKVRKKVKEEIEQLYNI